MYERCQREKRVLITFGLGFTDIRVYPPSQTRGIIVFAAGKMGYSTSQVGDMVAAAVQSKPAQEGTTLQYPVANLFCALIDPGAHKADLL